MPYFRVLFPLRMNRAKAMVTMSLNDDSSTQATIKALEWAIKKPTLATSHKTVVTASGQPHNGLCPVQVALAVNKNATAMVVIKPQSISWACQNGPAKGPVSIDGR